jgi:hypothetical protein
MPTVNITIPFTVDDDDIATMMDTNIYRSTSPWVGEIDRKDGPAGVRWTIRYDGENDDEGDYASTFTLQPLDVLNAFKKAAEDQLSGKLHGMCCIDEMIADKSVAIGCAQDSDIVLQYALLDGAVFG